MTEKIKVIFHDKDGIPEEYEVELTEYKATVRIPLDITEFKGC